MYIPRPFEETHRPALVEHIGRYPFATLITATAAGQPWVSHIPIYHQTRADGEYLVGHLAKANSHVRHAAGPGLVVFHGPHAYVSSRWSQSRNTVPTWNYTAVHVTGNLEVTDAEGLKSILEFMVARHEPSLPEFMGNLDEPVFQALAGQITGFQMRIESMEGKWKLSQNKSPETRSLIADELSAIGDEGSVAIAGLMRKGLNVKGNS